MPDLVPDDLKPVIVTATAAIAQAGLKIILILIAAWVGGRVVRMALHRVQTVLVMAGERTEAVPGATLKRVSTLTGLLRTLALVLIWTVALIICLSQVGIDVTPILAGAGIVGLAVGFGAQNIVRDLISGFFMVLENQVRVGDVAVVNGTGGLVEAITFRTIVLRDLAGVVHIFPNGAINTLANMTKDWSGYVIDVGVAYKEDTDAVIDVMKEVDATMRADPVLGPMMLQPIEIFGVDAFEESQVTIKARLRTLPIQQWAVGREYRRRLKKAFEARGIEIPFPHRSIYLGEATKPLEVLMRQAGGGGSPPGPGA